MTATYDCIATTTLGSANNSIDFTSISGSYTDLVLVALASNASPDGAENFRLRFNSDTASNYSNTRIYGNGSSAISNRETSQTYMFVGINGNSSSDFTVHTINIQNYSNSTTYKTVIARSSWASNYVSAYASLWRSTSAITSINISCLQNFRTGSTFTLYGIKAE